MNSNKQHLSIYPLSLSLSAAELSQAAEERIFFQRSNPALSLVPTPSPCRIDAKSKYQSADFQASMSEVFELRAK